MSSNHLFFRDLSDYSESQVSNIPFSFSNGLCWHLSVESFGSFKSGRRNWGNLMAKFLSALRLKHLRIKYFISTWGIRGKWRILQINPTSANVLSRYQVLTIDYIPPDIKLTWIPIIRDSRQWLIECHAIGWGVKPGTPDFKQLELTPPLPVLLDSCP